MNLTIECSTNATWKQHISYTINKTVRDYSRLYQDEQKWKRYFWIQASLSAFQGELKIAIAMTVIKREVVLMFLLTIWPNFWHDSLGGEVILVVSQYTFHILKILVCCKTIMLKGANEENLSNCLWWVVIVQLRINTLLHFVLTQSWSCL